MHVGLNKVKRLREKQFTFWEKQCDRRKLSSNLTFRCLDGHLLHHWLLQMVCLLQLSRLCQIGGLISAHVYLVLTFHPPQTKYPILVCKVSSVSWPGFKIQSSKVHAMSENHCPSWKLEGLTFESWNLVKGIVPLNLKEVSWMSSPGTLSIGKAFFMSILISWCSPSYLSENLKELFTVSWTDGFPGVSARDAIASFVGIWI